MTTADAVLLLLLVTLVTLVTLGAAARRRILVRLRDEAANASLGRRGRS